MSGHVGWKEGGDILFGKSYARTGPAAWSSPKIRANPGLTPSIQWRNSLFLDLDLTRPGNQYFLICKMGIINPSPYVLHVK